MIEAMSNEEIELISGGKIWDKCKTPLHGKQKDHGKSTCQKMIECVKKVLSF